MDKRYQAFVSSTYNDLVEERAEVMQALLELNCMPAGMELFPAASEEQWNWIKRVIDESDYYIVIVGGRYGSIHMKTGMSYTEMEYRYAIDIGKPAIAFLHEDPLKIEARRCETTEEGRDKLNDFRVFVQQKLCKFWSNPHDLGAKVSRSLTQLIRHRPAIGWVRANLADENSASEILNLRKTVEKLTNQLDELTNKKPEGTENLSQDSDKILVDFSYDTKKSKKNKIGSVYWVQGDSCESNVPVSWNEIFAAIAPKMLAPRAEYTIINALNALIWQHTINKLRKKHKNEKIEYIRIFNQHFETIKMQLRALGLVDIKYEEYGKEIWSLTPYGERHAVKLLAVHRPEEPTSGDVAEQSATASLEDD